MKRLFIITTLILSACATAPIKPQEPIIQIQKVFVPVKSPPCTDQLGVEPVYADTDAALSAAGGLYERTRLLVIGRLQRIKRLGQFVAVKDACK